MHPRLRSLVCRKRPFLGLLSAATVALLAAVGTPAQAAHRVYVANAGSHDVSQYLVGAGGLLAPLSPATVAVGGAATDVAVSPDGMSVYVTSSGPNPDSDPGTVSQYDVGANGSLSPKIPAAVPAGIGPQQVAVSPSGDSVYVTNLGPQPSGNGSVSQYDVGAGGKLSPKSPATVSAGLRPRGVAVSPDGRSVYVANGASLQPPGDGTVSQYSVAADGRLTPKAPAMVAPAGTFPQDVAVSPNGKSAYVAAHDYHGIGEVSQFGVGTGGKLIPKSPLYVSVGYSEPNDVTVSPDGKSAYVASGAQGDPDGPQGDVLQYDVAPSGKLSPKSPFLVIDGNDPRASANSVAVSPGGQSAYATSFHLVGSLSQFDVRAGGKLALKSPAAVAVGDDPSAVAVGPGPASVKVTGRTLVYRAAAGIADNVAITRPIPGTFRVSNLASGPYTGSAVRAGAGCWQSGVSAVKCNAAIVDRVQVLAGDRADRIVHSTGVGGSLNGGPGNDTVEGGWGSESLTGGSGANRLRGRGGDDLLIARNLVSDELIDCGPGSDEADLDELPKDPNPVVKRCESRTRH